MAKSSMIGKSVQRHLFRLSTEHSETIRSNMRTQRIPFGTPLNRPYEHAMNMPYEDNWIDYRKRRRLFWIVFLTYVPGASFIGILLEKTIGSEYPIYIVAILWMLAFAITGLRLTYWKCPRCNKHFFAKWWGVNQFARKCLHCGLPKWSIAE